jgi:hypothetical protein
MRDIRRGDVHQLLDDLVAEGKTGTAREVRKHLSSLFNWAVDREIVPDNPLYGMTRADLKNTHEAGRALEDDELRAVWQAAGDLGYPFGPMYRLLRAGGKTHSRTSYALLAGCSAGSRPRQHYECRRSW